MLVKCTKRIAALHAAHSLSHPEVCGVIKNRPQPSPFRGEVALSSLARGEMLEKETTV